MLNLREFLRATNPSQTLDIQKAEDRAYYINFSSVRGGEIIHRLKNKITVFEDEPTCTLFTGHIGCGKSTELLRLRDELEREGFYVVYFESSEDLEIADVEIADVLLTIARRIAQDLEKSQIQLRPTGFNKLLQEVGKILNAEVTELKVNPVKVPGLGEVGVQAKEGEFSLSLAIAQLTAKTKSDRTLHQKMNQYLAPQKVELVKAINRELLEPAIAQLKQRGKKGLVAIVDNLDRIDNTIKDFGKPQQEYLFVDQAESLKLGCHLVYTIPLALLFSNSYGMLTQRFDDPSVLPMVPTQLRDGTAHEEGMELLRQMVLARAFPQLDAAERLGKVTEIFELAELLDRLCRMSGGHVRDLLMLLNTWTLEEMKFPLTGTSLETVIRARRNAMTRAVSKQERELLQQVKLEKQVSDEEGYQKLIRSRFVFEYQDEEGSWYDVNPLLKD
ncbi:MAG: ATP-binding protein [Cyanobacteriota bacterium]|nr:ATP-binding protein [Cyanobacteriota bacterium]